VPGPTRRWSRPLRRLMPGAFHGRLTLGFVGVVALTLLLVSAVVVNRLDDYFSNQQRADLEVRARTVAELVAAIVDDASAGPVVGLDNRLDPAAARALSQPGTLRLLADRIAQADVRIRVGRPTVMPGGVGLVPAVDGAFGAPLQGSPAPGQAREAVTTNPTIVTGQTELFFDYGVEVVLSNPYTFRASTVANATGVLAGIALAALGIAVVVAAILARRFTTPLRELTLATREVAEGNLTSRVPEDVVQAGSTEMAELARGFNAMAARLQESIDTIRRDRDRSRDFLADVSHELRTPIAALRTFNDLLREGAADDPDAREEFLEQSAQQIERLDWLAQNLLELSKLDSGLVLLDLRPDDLRASIESAVEQAAPAARRRGVELTLRMPDGPVRVRHDPQRIGQVVTNLVGNALKFTPRGGSVAVELRPHREGAQIEVRDTGVGIDPSELPRIFERFYRGSRSNEARGSGSGLGLAIVRSIVDMHGGRVAVESRLGAGSTFTVTLPHDPRLSDERAAPPRGLAAGEPAASSAAAPEALAPSSAQVANSSPPEPSRLNNEPSR
jgi:signal transduction histidine kinase